jgi:GDP-L-fucose synthase
VVFHLAARVAGIGGNLAAPGEFFYENLVINTNVIEAARRAGAGKVVAVGTAAIYSDLVALPMSEDDLWLGPPHHSEAPYGHAKRAMLAHLEAYRQQYGLDFAYCILTNTFGPHDTFDEQRGHVMPSLISKFHRAANEGGAVTVWGTGAPTRDFLYVKDAARAIRLAGVGHSGPINVASGAAVSIRDVVEVIGTVSGHAGEVRWDASKPDGQPARGYDVSRLRALGFQPAYDLVAAVAETYAWYRDNRAVARHGATGRAPDAAAPGEVAAKAQPSAPGTRERTP